MSDYERVARIIRYVERHRDSQPDLARLAREAGLGVFHLHRLFSRWAGVTPKDFLQCLTVAEAKQRLRAGESVLDAALAAGLSGPGRLHDLCVTLEAATPGEWKAGGEGWTLVAGYAASPFGDCLIAEGPRGICHLAFVTSEGRPEAWSELRKLWPGAELRKSNERARHWAGRIFISGGRSGSSGKGALKAFVRGTPFQVRVWRALLAVPAGGLVSYGALAAASGCPGAARAVGTAVGRNPLAVLIPCHRVIRETGISGHYHWGAERKRAIQAWEAI